MGIRPWEGSAGSLGCVRALALMRHLPAASLEEAAVSRRCEPIEVESAVQQNRPRVSAAAVVVDAGA